MCSTRLNGWLSGSRSSTASFTNWKFQPADFVAAFGLHAALIVGERRAVGPEMIAPLVDQLPQLKVRLLKGGELVDEGSGRNALRSPALCVGELAAAIRRQEGAEPLAAGELVSTGTLTASHPVTSGEQWRVEVEGVDLPDLTLHVVYDVAQLLRPSGCRPPHWWTDVRGFSRAALVDDEKPKSAVELAMERMRRKDADSGVVERADRRAESRDCRSTQPARVESGRARDSASLARWPASSIPPSDRAGRGGLSARADASATMTSRRKIGEDTRERGLISLSTTRTMCYHISS